MYKVLYVAGGFIGSTTLDRKEGLIRAGWEIVHFDTDPWMRDSGKIWKSIHHRIHRGPLIWSFNKAIAKAAARENPEIVWVDKGIWVEPRTIERIKQMGAIVAHFTPDSPSHPYHDTPNFIQSIPVYDIVFSTKRWDMALYRKYGARNLVYSQKSTCTSRTRPLHPESNELATYETDLVFIGRAEPHYIMIIKQIILCIPDIRLKIWGAWGKAVEQHPEISTFWQGRGAYGDEYAKALTSAKIGLGLLTKLVEETETARSFEIPACGTFLLAERTASHLSLYEEGREAEFFDSVEEAVEKITYYLEHDAERDAIACAGYRRFIDSDYTTDRFMRECAKEVESLF